MAKEKKNLRRISLVIGVLLILCTSLWAKVKEELPQEKMIVVGYVPNYGMIQEPVVQGNVGYGYEYLLEVSKYTGYRFHYVPVKWEEAFQKLETGEIDLFGPVGQTKERMEQYIYSQKPFSYEDFLLVKDSTPLTQGKIAGTQHQIGVVENTTYHEYLKNDSGFVSDSQELVLLESGQEQTFLNESEGRLFLGSTLNFQKGFQVIERVVSKPIYLITSKENEVLMEHINEAMQRIEEESRLFADELYLKYYGNYEQKKFDVTEEDLQHIQAKETYFVGYKSDYAPFMYQDEKGDAKGTSIEVMNFIAQQLGIHIVYVPDETLNSGNIDFDLNVFNQYTINTAYTTKAYVDGNLVIIKRGHKSLDEIETIGTLPYNALNIKQTKSIDERLVITESIEEGYDLLRTNAVDAIIVENYTALHSIEALDVGNYEVEITNMRQPLALKVSKNLPFTVFDTLNKTIKGLDIAEVEKIMMNHTIQTSDEKTLREVLYKYRARILEVVAVTTGIFIWVVFWQYKNKKDSLKELLEVDTLTGVMTKYRFLKEVKHRLQVSNKKYILASIDINDFKHVNKMLGYQKGNQILKMLVQTLQGEIREGDLLARDANDVFLMLIEGDEYHHFLCEHTGCKACKQKSCEIRFEDNYIFTLAKGVYPIEDKHEELSTMLDYVNSARIENKKTYDRSWTLFTPTMKRMQQIQSDIVANMVQALEAEEFYPVFQPKINLQTGEVTGAEALVRWRTKDGRVVYPNVFIPTFEMNGFITQLDYYMLEKVCQMIANTEQKLPRISINLSTVSAQQPDLIEQYMGLIAKYGISPQQIEIEITESAFTENVALIDRQVDGLRARGITISMDDFGSGISSLNRLQDMNLDIIKLDRGFIREALPSEKGLAIIKNVITMSRDLQLKTVAEGIETKEQLELLRQLGCTSGQGYYFSKPIEEQAFMVFLKTYTGSEK